MIIYRQKDNKNRETRRPIRGRTRIKNEKNIR